MTRVYVDATTLVALDQVGELDLLGALDGTVVLPDAVCAEVTTESPRTNLERFVEDHGVEAGPVETGWTDDAMRVLDAAEPTSNVQVVKGILDATADGSSGNRDGGGNGDGDSTEPAAGLVSEDRRLRTVAEGLGATVTSTFVVVRAALVRTITSRRHRQSAWSAASTATACT